MTDRSDTLVAPVARPAPAAPARKRRPRLAITAMAALAGFFVIFELLAFQLRSGGDPALGQSALTAASTKVAPGAPRGATSPSAVATRTSGSAATTSPVALAPGAKTPTAQTTARTLTTRPVRTRSSGGTGRQAFGEREAGDDA